MDIKRARGYVFCFLTDNVTHLTHEEIEAFTVLYNATEEMEQKDAGRTERKENKKKSRRSDINR